MNQKILLVDDEPAALNCYRRMLEGEFDIATASSGEEGLVSASRLHHCVFRRHAQRAKLFRRHHARCGTASLANRDAEKASTDRNRVQLQNRLEALLEETHIKLSSLVSDLLSVRALRMLKAQGDGETPSGSSRYGR